MKSTLICLLLAALLVFPPGRSGAETGSPAGFLTYLSGDHLEPLLLAELRRLALEEGNLAALREYAGALGEAGLYSRAGAFADSVECPGEVLAALAALIKAEGQLRRGDYRTALAAADALVHSFPGRGALVEAQYLRARCLAGLGDWDEARIHLRALRAAAGEDLRSGVLYHLARCDETLGDYREAAAGYEALHEAGIGEGTAGLMRCKLRLGDVDGAQDAYREAVVRGVPLPHEDLLELVDVAGWGAPDLWKDLLNGLARDTTFVPTPELSHHLLRAVERGQDVRRYCGDFLAAGGPQELRFVRALSLGGRAGYDSLAVLMATNEEYRSPEYTLALAGAASPEEQVPMPDDVQLSTVGGAYWERAQPDEAIHWLNLLVANGRTRGAAESIERCRAGLVAGFDDAALLELAVLLDRAGAASEALGIYAEVAASPVPSSASLAGERALYMAQLALPADGDVSAAVEEAAAGDMSLLELGELFEVRLGDFGRAADYYQRALAETEDPDERDRIRMRAASAFSRHYLKTGEAASRDKALNLAAGLAGSGAVEPGDVLDVLKSSTEWLTLDLFRCTETARQVAAREDLDHEAAYELARVLYRLYERGDTEAYDICSGVLDGPLGGELPGPMGERAALLKAELGLLSGDYAGALADFEACLKTAKQQVTRRLAGMGMGDCYAASGGLEEGLKHYGQAGRSPAVGLRRARCLMALGMRDEAREAALDVLKYYNSREESAAARLLAAACAPGPEGLDRDALNLYYPHYHHLRVYRDMGEYARLLAACDLSARGYDGPALRVLEGLRAEAVAGAGPRLLVSGYDPVEGKHAEFFRALDSSLGAHYRDALDQYAGLRLRAQLECGSEDHEACGRAAGRFKARFPLALSDAAGIDALDAASLYRQMYVGRADAIADSLFRQGLRSELLAEAVYRKGVSFLLEKAYDEARRTFLIMQEHFSGSRLYPDVSFKLGTTYFLMEDYDSSAAFFRLAVSEGKVALLEDALFNLGLALEESGDLAAASEAFRELAVRFPFSGRFERALMRGAYCLDRSGHAEDAAALYRVLLEYSRAPAALAEANFWLGEALAEAGRHLEAALEFLRTAYFYPGEEAWAGTARYRAGNECESAGLMEAAELVYGENVAEFGRDSTWGKASYERLAELAGED